MRLISRLGSFSSAAYLGGLVVSVVACSGSEQTAEQYDEVAVARAPLDQANAPITVADFLVSLPASAPFERVVLSASEQLTVRDAVNISGNGSTDPLYVTSTGSGGVELGNGASHHGSVLSVGNVTLQDNATVTGNVATTGTVKYQNPSSAKKTVPIKGTVSTGAKLTPLAVHHLKVAFPATTTSIDLQPEKSGSPKPGSYTSVNIKRASVLKLKSGTYYFDSFTAESASKIVLDTSNGPVKVFVRSSLTCRANITGDAAQFLLAFAGTNQVDIDAPFAGTVWAPHATLRLSPVNGEGQRGSFFAKQIWAEARNPITFVPFTGWNDLLFQDRENAPLMDGVSGLSQSVLDTLQPDNPAGLSYTSAPLVAGPGLMNDAAVPGGGSCVGGVCTIEQPLTAASTSFRIHLTKVWEEDNDNGSTEDESYMNVWLDGASGLGRKWVNDCAEDCGEWEGKIDTTQETVQVRIKMWEDDDSSDDDRRFDHTFVVNNITGEVIGATPENEPDTNDLYQREGGYKNEWCATKSGSGACWVIETTGTAAFCSMWSAQYIDSGLGEDYANVMGVQRVPAAFALGAVSFYRGSEKRPEHWSGIYDQDGCVPTTERLTAANFLRKDTTGRPLTVVIINNTQFCLDPSGMSCKDGSGMSSMVQNCTSRDCRGSSNVCVNGDCRHDAATLAASMTGTITGGPARTCVAVTEDPTIAALLPEVVDNGCTVVEFGSGPNAGDLITLEGKSYFGSTPTHSIETRAAAVISTIFAQEFRTNDMGLTKYVYDGLGEIDLPVFTNAGCEVDGVVDSCVSAGRVLINGSFGDCPGEGCVTDDLSESYVKTIVAHEIGHVVQALNGGNPTSPLSYLGDATEGDPLVRCDHVVGSNRYHCLQSWELSSAAQGEGYAQFFASKTWNNPLQDNCSFAYYKEVLHPDCLPGAAGCEKQGKTGLNVNLTPVPVSCTNTVRWRNKYAAELTRNSAENVGYIGTEWDWMTFYWNLNRDSISAWSINDLGTLYTQACGGHCAGQDNDSFDFTTLDAAAQVLIPDHESPKYQRLIFNSEKSGVGANLDP